MDLIPLRIVKRRKLRMLEAGLEVTEAKNRDLEALIVEKDRLIAQVDSQRAAAELAHRDIFKECYGVDLPSEITGPQTKMMGRYMNIMHHINTGQVGLAERELNELLESELSKSGEEVLYEFEHPDQKMVVLPEKFVGIIEPQTQGLNLKKIWYLKRYPSREQSKVSYEVLNNLYKLGQDREDSLVPLVGEVKYAGMYMLEEIGVGPDLFDLFEDLNRRIQQGSEFGIKLKEALVNRNLEDLVFLQTQIFPIQEEHNQDSECEEKLVDVYREFDGFDHLEAKLSEIGRTLDSTDDYFFRDAGLWNTWINYRSLFTDLKDQISIEIPQDIWDSVMTNDYDLQDVNDYLFGLAEDSNMKNTLQSLFIFNVYQRDFETSHRKTFWRDDLIHILMNPLSSLNPRDITTLDPTRIREKEQYFLDLAKGDRNFENANLEDFYRHSRLWQLSMKGVLPKKQENHSYFHLAMAYSALHTEVHGNSPSQNELEIVRDNTDGKAIPMVFNLLENFNRISL